MVCPLCKAESPEGARFCNVCGAPIRAAQRAPATVESTVAHTAMSGGIFVGREDEVAELTSALNAAVEEGRGRLLMLAGEPGIGKTRTARQIEAAAEARGARVLWGRGFEEGGAPPLWIWVQSLRAYVETLDPAVLREELGPGAPDVAEVVPEVRRVLPDLDPAPPLEPDQARFRFYDSVTAFLKRACARQPLVFILDDLHWADRPSLLLLEFLAPELANRRLLILGTYRDAELSRRHPLAQTLSQLAKEQQYHRILLRGLSQQDVAAFLAARIGTPPRQALVEAVYRRTEGNPLFISELVRLLEQEGVLSADQLGQGPVVLPGRIPEGVREVIGRRLDRLSADCNRVLRAASAVGRAFDLGVLQSLLGDLPPARIVDAVEEAVPPGLVEATPDPPSHYRFTHILIQQTLDDELTPSERAGLHGRIADALERLYGDDVEAHAVELAHHLSKSAGASDPARLARYCRLAGQQALGLHAYQEAVDYFERALDCIEGDPTDAQQAAILSGLGQAQAAALPRQKTHEAVATLTRAFEAYVAAGDPDGAIEAAVLPFYPVWGQPSGQTELLTRALELVPPASTAAARLLCRYGRLLAIEEFNLGAARPALQRGLEIAVEKGDLALELRALADAANADLVDMAREECLARVSRALEIAHGVNDPQAELAARYSAVQMSFAGGDCEGVASFGLAMLPLAESLRDRFWLASAHRARAYVHWLRGDFNAARAESDLSLAVAPDEPRDLAIRAQIEYETGSFGQGRRYLDRLVGLTELVPSVLNLENMLVALVVPIVARIGGSHGVLALAKQAARLAVPLEPQATRAPLMPHPIWAGMLHGQAYAVVMQRDRAAARQVYDTLEGSRNHGYVFTTTCAERLLGLLARTFGDEALARQHFEAALRFCERRGLRPELAWTSFDFASLLARSATREDRGHCADLVNQALSSSRDLGMLPLHARAMKLAQRLDPRSPTRMVYPDALTAREVEVIRLMARGKTDRSIADELVISPRTVSRHVSSILAKTQSANRTEAAAYALRHGLD